MFRVEKSFTTGHGGDSEAPVLVATFALEDEASWYCRLLNKQSDNLGLGLTYSYLEE